MSIKYCYNCEAKNDTNSDFCHKCGHPISVNGEFIIEPKEKQEPKENNQNIITTTTTTTTTSTGIANTQFISTQKQYNPFIAVLLSFFITGLGQIYKGQIWIGILWFGFVLVSYSISFTLGFVLWFACLLDAGSSCSFREKSTYFKIVYFVLIILVALAVYNFKKSYDTVQDVPRQMQELLPGYDPTGNNNYNSTKTNDLEEEISYKKYALMVLDWNWKKDEYGFVTVEGQVKNLTNKPLHNVVVVAQFYTKNNSFITSSTTLIEYNPIMSSQISPFQVIEQYNPLMDSVSINFKHLLGGTIPRCYSKE